ncbi:MAG: hypothetical protein H6741_12870 [Alphaproteobacteria bacterium]|nr:hypothetical protein [Alphaproteobacteria bacterium]
MRASTLSLLGMIALIGCRTDKDLTFDSDPDPVEVDEDGDGFSAEEDCDDNDAAIHPEAEEICDGIDNNCDDQVDEGVQVTVYADADADGYGDDASASEACAAEAGQVLQGGDCDDSDPAYNPGADESDCADPNDYNCDGSVGYADNDGDGYAACEECDDADAAVNPAAQEVCNDVDDDCDGLIDDADDSLDASTGASFYADADGDGYGDPASALQACEAPDGAVSDATDCDDSDAGLNNDDADGDGESSCAGDCDDGDSAVNSSGTELCDGVDNDCDGATDEDDAADAATWYADADGDGYGDAAAASQACAQPSGAVSDSADCDDGDAAVNPGAQEICNALDDDCDGAVDDADSSVDTSGGDTWYYDGDGDGDGDASVSTRTCDQPSGYVADGDDCDDGDSSLNQADADGDGESSCDGDCDDADAGIYTSATETWYDGVDADCAGDSDYDADGDGFDAVDYSGDDCDDANASILPESSGACALGASCEEVLANGYTSDGNYDIDPDGYASGDDPFEVYCDQTEDGGGWTLLLAADGDSTYWGNNSSNWMSAGFDTSIPTGLSNADFHGQAYGTLDTDEIRLCYQDATACYVFVHSQGMPLLDFFTDGVSHVEYSYDSLGYTDTGSSQAMTDYLAAVGFTKWNTSCYWLGINDTLSISAIGLLGDSNGGCSSLSGSVPHHDDLAIGLGLQSCRDNNGCANGGSGHAAGDSRGANGVDDSGNFGPWFVFGR